MRSSTARIARTFSCSVLKIYGMFRRMLMPSEAETACSAGLRALPKICNVGALAEADIAKGDAVTPVSLPSISARLHIIVPNLWMTKTWIPWDTGLS